MTSIEKIATLSNRLNCQPRIKLKLDDAPEAWGYMGIYLPVSGSIELHGPRSFGEVEWLEINPVVIEHIGRLVAPRQWSHLEQIVSLLQSEGINYSIIDSMIRIPFTGSSNI